MSSFARRVAVNSSLYAIGRISVSVIGVVATALATRYLGPDRFGALTTSVAFVSAVALLCDLGLYQVVVRELARRPAERRHLLANTLTLGLGMSLFAFAVTIGLMELLYGGASRHLVRVGILIQAVQLLFNAFGGTASAHLVSEERGAPAAFAGLASSGVLVCILAAAKATDAPFGVVAAAYSLQGITYSFVLLFAARRSMTWRLRVDVPLWRSLAGRALAQAAVVVVTAVYFRLDTILVSLLSTDRQVALYGVAYRVLEGLIMLPVVFMLALFPELARQEQGSGRLRELVQNAFSTVVAGVVPVAIFVAVFAGQVVRLIAGASFSDATVVLQILMAAVAMNFAVTVFFQTLVAVGQQSRLVVAMAATLVANVAVNAGLIPVLGARGAAISLIVSEAVSLALVLRVIAPVGGIPRIERPRALLVATVLAAAAALGIDATHFADAAPAVAVLAVGGVAVVAVYGLVLVLLRGVPNGLEMVAAPIERLLRLRPAAGQRGT